MIARDRTDVVVIGGSLSGAACALQLARRGVGAIVFDRRAPGAPRVCGSFLSPGAVRALDALDLADALRRAGAVTIEAAELEAGPTRLEIPFARPGLGFSRARLDAILAARAGVRWRSAVEGVEETGSGYRVRVRDGDGAVAEVVCRVVVDAAGRSSRFSRRRPTGAYGVQFESSAARTRVLRFGFYRWGYGGSVSVEQGRVNSCFLVGGEHLSRFSDRPGHRVTGPIGYELLEGPYLTVGDAAGMIDPFCGEGMRHAVESGCLAAETLWDGFRSGASPGEIRSRYRAEWRRRWAAKRLLSRRLRWIFSREWAARAGLRLTGTCPAIARTCLEELWR